MFLEFVGVISDTDFVFIRPVKLLLSYTGIEINQLLCFGVPLIRQAVQLIKLRSLPYFIVLVIVLNFFIRSFTALFTVAVSFQGSGRFLSCFVHRTLASNNFL